MNAVRGLNRTRHYQWELRDHGALALGERWKRPVTIQLRPQQRTRSAGDDYGCPFANKSAAGVDDNGHFVGPMRIRTSLILQGEDARAGNLVDNTADKADAQPGDIIDEQCERVGAEPKSY